MITSLNQLDLNKKYTYADYLTWQLQERVELILGKIFRMSPAPKTDHQSVLTALTASIYNFLRERPCKVFPAPFDVRLPLNPGDPDDKTDTVVQPDICVVCDTQKIDTKGCNGAPDLVVEIISQSSVKKDLHEKYQLYENTGVKEYWIVYPSDKSLIIHRLDENNKYQPSRMLTEGDVATSTVLYGLKIELDEAFKNVLEESQEQYGTEINRI